MDVAILNKNTLRVKGKTASLVIDPTPSLGKTEADAILLLGDSADQVTGKVEGARITIKGPGEYEVGGIKVSAIQVGNDLVASLDVDGVKLLVGKGSTIEEIHDKIEECQIAVINSEGEFNHSFLTSLEPNALLIYGVGKEEVVKSLGKTDAAKASKFSTTSEKLPTEMEVVLLG